MRPILAEAVGLARRALLELQPEGVGEHLGVTAEDECAATHHFAATLPGYRGWQWAVVVAAPPEADRATVSESALLPGPDALVAPDFVPWDQRVRPGDLAPGDLLATPTNDPRLVPGYQLTGDPVFDEICEEVGQGRPQVLSREGREEAAERWFAEYGPDTDMARAAPSTCRLCGFFVPLAGSLRAAYGVCANVMGADGHVVHAEYGCGAHSDTELPTGGGSPLYEAYDDAAFEVIPPEELRGAQPDGGAAQTVTDAAVADVTTAGSEADAVVVESRSDGAASAPDTGAATDAEAAEGRASAEGGPVVADAADAGSVVSEASTGAADRGSVATESRTGAAETAGSPAEARPVQAQASTGASAPDESAARAIRSVESAAASMRQAADIGRQTSEFAAAFNETVIDPSESAGSTAGVKSDAADVSSVELEAGVAERVSSADTMVGAEVEGAEGSAESSAAAESAVGVAGSADRSNGLADAGAGDVSAVESEAGAGEPDSAADATVESADSSVGGAVSKGVAHSTESAASDEDRADRYRDAWAVSAVRVRPEGVPEGASGTSEQN